MADKKLRPAQIDYLHPDGKSETAARTELEKKNQEAAKESTELVEQLKKNEQDVD